MSNTLAAHYPVIVAKDALHQLRASLVMTKRVTRNYEKEVKTKGKTVDVPKYGALSANDKALNGNVTVQDANSDTVSITLNKHKESTFLIEDPERAFSGEKTEDGEDIISGYTKSAVTAITEAVESDLMDLYSGVSTQIGVAGTDVSEALFLSLRKTLADNKAPKKDEGLTFVYSTKDQNALLGIDKYINGDYAPGNSAIADGATGKIYNFHTFESTEVKVVSGSPDATHNLGFHRGAFALAVRPLPAIPQGLGELAFVIDDPMSGLAVRVRMSYNSDRGGIQTTVEILYGVGELRDELAVDVLS